MAEQKSQYKQKQQGKQHKVYETNLTLTTHRHRFNR